MFIIQQGELNSSDSFVSNKLKYRFAGYWIFDHLSGTIKEYVKELSFDLILLKR